MNKNLLLQNTLAGHALRSLLLIAAVGAYVQHMQQRHQSAELRDALNNAVAVKPAAPKLERPERLPTDYQPKADGLMMLSKAQIAAHQRRAARVAERRQAAVKKTRALEKSAPKAAPAAPKRPSAKELRRQRALELYKRTRGRLRQSRGGGIAAVR